MIQAILSFQFVLNSTETGDIEPEFTPLRIVSKNDKFNQSNHSNLLGQDELFAIFYQHTTGVMGKDDAYGNFYKGRIKGNPYQLVSYFRQETDGSQFLTLIIFDLDDEIEVFDKIIKQFSNRLDVTLETLVRAKLSNQVSLIKNVQNQLNDDIKFTVFQLERLTNLERLQKAALIFTSEERLKILNILQEGPISKKELKTIMEKINIKSNIDILLSPFMELNLIRRDWAKGERSRQSGRIENSGEFIFLIKDIVLSRIPNESLIKKLKETESKVENSKYWKYKKMVSEFFSKYDPLKEPIELKKKLANLLLNPDLFDFFKLMKNNYYPLDKIPKILSTWADVSQILDELKNLEVITEVIDENDRHWIMLLTDIQPLIIFPEYILSRIKKAYDKKIITQEIAKKAYQLLEVSFPETVEF